MIALARKFVTVADEVGRLQRAKTPECVLFREVAEQGHYAGRTDPSDTRQGIYAFAPSGAFLASCNTRRARVVAAMLTKALARWRELPPAQRRLELGPDAGQRVRRAEDLFPRDGLVLHLVLRDLPRAKHTRGWRGRAWNQDHVWFNADEARAFLPTKLEKGARREVPRSLVVRLATLHLLDSVRGQTSAFSRKDVSEARLVCEITAVEDAIVTLRLRGATRTRTEGKWAVHGFDDMNSPSHQARGVQTDLLGHARYHLRRARFSSFELIALGTRFGGTTYNSRGDDLEPSGIGFLFTLASGKTPGDRVAPAFMWRYHWQR